MRIQELELLTDADRATIRFYEKQGLITPQRSENGYRDYAQEDVEELKKILFLRELGLSIDTIRNLQLGKEELAEVMARQALVLTNKSEQMAQASTVCEALSREGIGYTQLDTTKFQTMLNAPKQQSGASLPGGTGRYSEHIEKEVHPWRRYIARHIDHTIIHVLIFFLVVVVVRKRPVTDGLQTWISIGSWFLLIPIEAALLHYFGSTPGKWMMGIKIEDCAGGRLSFTDAMSRTFGAVLYGTAFGVPFITEVCMLWQYCKLTGRSWRRFRRYDDMQAPEDMAWDEKTEISYDSLTRKNWLVFAGLILAVLAVSGIISADSVKPKYRGSELTVAQFAENYNDYLEMLGDDVAEYQKLREDGSRYPIPNNVIIDNLIIVTEGNVEGKEPIPFQYETEHEILRSVSLEKNWTDVVYLSPLAGEPMYIAASILLAQDGCGYAELAEFGELWDQYMGKAQARFTYRNIEISWNIESENCIIMTDGGYIKENQESGSTINMQFTVTIH